MAKRSSKVVDPVIVRAAEAMGAAVGKARAALESGAKRKRPSGYVPRAERRERAQSADRSAGPRRRRAAARRPPTGGAGRKATKRSR